ncbi:MAG: sulfatase [Deltaproteobacteria bacterium]|nr:sulfatase [Deltaproteobacteria bacterium]
MLRRLIDSPWTYFALAGLLVLGTLVWMFDIRGASRHVGTIESDLAKLRERQDVNVVFVLIDTLRADRLSSYGYARETSPNMDVIADNGVRFARAQSQSSWTKCSMASLWTGLFPQRSGVTRFDHALPDSAVMPAELFSKAGYTTAGIFRNGWVSSNFGFQQGFDLYLKPMPRTDAAHVERKGRTEAQLAGTDEDVTLSAIEFLKTNQREKFLLYLHYMDVHQYVYDDAAAEQKFGDATIANVYDRSIHWTDRNIAALISTLDTLDLSKRTIVVIAADHGEAFGEHGREGHATDIHQEVVHVPLMFQLPFRVEGGLVVDSLVRNVDIWPTLLDLVGLPALPDTDGISLVPMMQAAARGEVVEAPPAHAYIDQVWGQIEMEPKPLVGVQRDTQRVIYSKAKANETLQVYDLATDPGERRNLRKNPPAWSEELRTQLDESFAWRKAPWGEGASVELDEMELNQLRALGYVVGEGQVGQDRVKEIEKK